MMVYCYYSIETGKYQYIKFVKASLAKLHYPKCLVRIRLSPLHAAWVAFRRNKPDPWPDKERLLYHQSVI